MNNQEVLELQRANQQHLWGHLSQQRWNAVQTYKQGTVLDVGCANGIYVNHLQEIGVPALGIDLLSYKEWKNLPNRIIMADAKTLPCANESFDTIISFETLEHVPEPIVALQEYQRVCRKNIIVSVPNCETPPILRESGMTYHHWVDRSHVNFFTMQMFQEMIEQSGFRIVKAEYINPILPAKPLFSALGLPKDMADWLARAFRKISRQQYYMTLLVVAEK